MQKIEFAMYLAFAVMIIATVILFSVIFDLQRRGNEIVQGYLTSANFICFNKSSYNESINTFPSK